MNNELETEPISESAVSIGRIISLFEHAMAKEPDRAISMQDFLSGVRGGRWQRPIKVLRKHIEMGNRSRYDTKKRELPAVTISCHCLSRERELSPEARAVTHSGFLQADFDLKDNPILADPGAVTAMRASLLADPHVGAVFVGPSGEGLKSIVAIDPARHADSWFAAEAHFRDSHNLKLDRATKDPIRLCFVSHDPDAQWKPHAEPLPLPDLAKSHASGGNDWRPPVETTAADIAEMLSFVPPRPDYDTWLKIASAVWSVLPMFEGAALLNQWSPEERDGEYMTKHKARLKQIGIGSLCHLAAQHGFDARAAWRRKRWAGRIRFADCERSPGDAEDPSADTSLGGKLVEFTRERVIEALAGQQAGDAKLWVEMRRGLRVWNIHAKMWMIYDAGLWSRDVGHSTPWDISDALCAGYQGLADSIRHEMAENPAPDAKKDPRAAELKSVSTRLDQLRRWDHLSSVEKFCNRSLYAPATDFDRNPDILVLENGALDFAEGIFREHRPSDMASTCAPILFDPDAECPAWDAFLERFIPDEETRAYLARAVGYSLTGRVNHDVIFFCYGKGANGKSTFLSALKLLVGDLMTTVPIAALLAAKSDNNFDYHKASMEGKRIVLTDEIPEGRKLAEHQIKAVTGGDPINARRPFEQPYTFFPTHKLWLMGNHKPEISGTDEGIWRRVHLIPFLVTIPENERRPRHEVLMEFQREASGILNWAIRGLLESRDIGLMPPATVLNATKAYREESDQFGTFLAECTERNVLATCLVASLGKVYRAWCDENDEVPRHKGTKALRKAMFERGWEIFTNRKDQPEIAGLALRKDTAENAGKEWQLL